MTKEEQWICRQLGLVNYLPGSFDKRLGKNLAAISANKPTDDLSEKQREWMYRLLYKYRKQLPRTYELFKNHPHCAKAPKRENK